jgi:hypothetical protein
MKTEIRSPKPETRKLVLTMKLALLCALLLLFAATGLCSAAESAVPTAASRPTITTIDAPESGFFAKRLDYDGIAIKAPTNVVDEALFVAYGRLNSLVTEQ